MKMSTQNEEEIKKSKMERPAKDWKSHSSTAEPVTPTTANPVADSNTNDTIILFNFNNRSVENLQNVT